MHCKRESSFFFQKNASAVIVQTCELCFVLYMTLYKPVKEETSKLFLLSMLHIKLLIDENKTKVHARSLLMSNLL